MGIFCTHVNFGTIGPYFAVLLFQKYGLEKKRVINAWFCEYPSFLVLWCENDCNDAFDAFFIMSTLQSMCNFSALLSVNKPKICFRGPKMNDKNLRQNVTQTSLFGNKINLFWKMRHFRPFSHSWILKEFEGFYDIKIKCLIFNKVVCGFFISIRISVSSVKWSVGFLSLKKRKLLIMQLLYEFNYSWHYLI